ncbi:MAG: hypothetical protein ACYCZ0_00260 [Minisyncoccota bacterium]
MSHAQVIAIRDAMPGIVASTLRVQPEDVEVLVRDFGEMDINIAPLGIDILTGSGKHDDWRLKRRQELSVEIECMLFKTGLIKRTWVKHRSYVWLMVVGSSFVPFGSPELRR